jgi:hypothetical protein
VSALYYTMDYPPSAETLERFRPLQQRLNAAADPSSDEYRELRALLSTPAKP